MQLDRDFVLNIALARPFEPCAVVAPDGPGAHALMINLYPDLGQFARQPAEYVFVVDRSGSMAGESIEQALNALRLALRSLEEGDAFNIVGFGSRFQLMFPQSRPYTQASLDEATRQLESWDADLGGTELLAPLQAVLGGPGGALPRRVMLLTDGQVANEAACIALAAEHAAAVRIFTFGIGYGASEHLVKGLARASGGKAEFIHPNERIEPVVMRQFARAAAPSLRQRAARLGRPAARAGHAARAALAVRRRPAHGVCARARRCGAWRRRSGGAGRRAAGHAALSGAGGCGFGFSRTMFE